LSNTAKSSSRFAGYTISCFAKAMQFCPFYYLVCLQHLALLAIKSFA
jgi:hypothetical protein